MSIEKTIKIVRTIPDDAWLGQYLAPSQLHELADGYEYLQERLHKCDGMASEINILTVENRILTTVVTEFRRALEQVVETYHIRHRSAPEHWLALYNIAQAVLNKYKETK